LAAVADALHEQERLIRLATAHDGHAFGVLALTESRVLWAAVGFAPAPWCWPGRGAAYASRRRVVAARASKRVRSGGSSTGSSPPMRSTNWRISSLTAVPRARRSPPRPSNGQRPACTGSSVRFVRACAGLGGLGGRISRHAFDAPQATSDSSMANTARATTSTNYPIKRLRKRTHLDLLRAWACPSVLGCSLPGRHVRHRRPTAAAS
jgi:hypothetical protein